MSFIESFPFDAFECQDHERLVNDIIRYVFDNKKENDFDIAKRILTVYADLGIIDGEVFDSNEEKDCFYFRLGNRVCYAGVSSFNKLEIGWSTIKCLT